MQVKECFAPKADGKPGLLVFDTCKQFIDDIQAIQASEKDPNDCATEPHDITHLPDACRYFCISRVLKNVEEEAVQLQDELDEEEEYESYMTGGEISNAYIFA